MNPRGEDLAQSVREWMREEIKKGPQYIYELGRFFFTVSSFTMGLVIASEKLQPVNKPSWPVLTTLGLFFISILISLRMTIPKIQMFSEEIDLYDIYIRHTRRLIILSTIWFAMWGLGLGFLVIRLYFL